MNSTPLERMFKKLRSECTPAPINAKKIIRVFQYDEKLMHEALHLFAQGKFESYHMIPGNGGLEF